MGRKLSLTVALAVFAAAVVAGVGRAQSPNSAPASAACSNGIDDDGDGLVDTADPGCSSPSDGDESNPLPPPASATGPTGVAGSTGPSGPSGPSGSTG
ncbi:MAG: hypothetical protein ACRDK1_11415, partial [Solirubrobacterales bacterium]